MRSVLLTITASLFLLSPVLAQNDWVNLAALPQMNFYAQNYSHNIFSGYLNSQNGDSLHYIFLESQGNPKTDPLILWLNGGPGCSSLLGWLYEHGPFVFGDGSMNLEWNQYSWNNLANMIYMESPACVGYSTCNNPEEIFTDDGVAQGNLEALLSFFQKYQNFTSNSFYIAGESYGGIYVPYLSWYVDQYNANAKNPINFKGYLVGNGVTNWNYDTSASMPDYLYYHAVYPPSIRNEILYETCLNTNSEECQDFLFESEYTSDLNLYDIYRWCYNETETVLDLKAPVNQSRDYARFLKLNRQRHNPSLPTHTAATAPCIDGMGAYAWLNLPTVRQGLHIQSSINYDWSMCSEINYNITTIGSYWIYEQFVPQNKYQIMFYSGDTDSTVSILGTQKWIKQLVNLESIPVEVPLKIWTLPGNMANETQTAGWVVYYQGLEFVNVKGVGHMVPQWQRPAAFKMLEYYLENKVLD